MNKVAIIGIGNLGLRHLESLYNSKIPLKIYAHDPSEIALKNAKIYLDKYVDIETEITYSNNINNIPDKLDVVIIATNSKVRLRVIEDLLKLSKVEYIILEKVLFQNPNEYEICNNLLTKNNVKAFVNCPMRTYEIYKKVKAFFENEICLKMHVIGGDWSLGCNSIHYIDLFSFLINSKLKSCNLKLDKEIKKSKRDGYIEFTGQMDFRTKNNILTLISLEDIFIGKEILIFSKNKYCRINEFSQSSEFFDGKETLLENFRIPYQSELTSLIVSDLIKSGTCNLTNYMDSKHSHLLLINKLIEFNNTNVNKDLDFIAIT